MSLCLGLSSAAAKEEEEEEEEEAEEEAPVDDLGAYLGLDEGVV